MPNKTKQNTKNSTEQICSQPLYKSQTTHHTQPTPVNPAGCARNHHNKAADAHTVLNVNPTVCLSAENFYAQPKNAPTPTTHDRAVNTCRHKKTTNTTQQAMLLVPHKLGSLERR